MVFKKFPRLTTTIYGYKRIYMAVPSMTYLVHKVFPFFTNSIKVASRRHWIYVVRLERRYFEGVTVTREARAIGTIFLTSIMPANTMKSFFT